MLTTLAIIFFFQELVISQNFSGHLVAHTDWPAALKNKGVYFIKRDMKPLPKENFLNVMTCGDIHPNALDHFCAWVEEVSICCNFWREKKNLNSKLVHNYKKLLNLKMRFFREPRASKNFFGFLLKKPSGK